MSRKAALVTGGIGAIGTEVCKALASQGRQVVAVHLPAEQRYAKSWQNEMKQSGYSIEVVPADVSEFTSACDMVMHTSTRFGDIEVLVNCAGITRDATLKKMELRNWTSVINTNLNSLYNVSKHVLPHMVESGFGRVVNISSVNGQKGQFGQTNYSAAKAGVHGFTMALAQEVASKGVTVNTVSPGYVETPMTAEIPEDIRTAIVASVPVGRMARASEVAKVVAFLTQEDAAYITGANIPVNGGLYMS